MIETRELTKRYGDTLAVDAISFRAEPGVVTGFLGPNGAGKSTTMRMILGLDRPTSGAALVNGRRYVDAPAPMAEVDALLDVVGPRPDRGHHLQRAVAGQRDDASPSGLGLIGMRERVSAHGGTLETGPRPDGTYVVHALLPARAPPETGVQV